jgi:hypothetical protein
VLQCGSLCFFAIASLRDVIANERLGTVCRVQGTLEFFRLVVQQFYGLYCAGGEKSFAIEGIMGFERCIFGHGALVETRLW